MVVDAGVDDIHDAAKKESLTVRRRPHHRFGAQAAAGARLVLGDELLAEPLRKLLSDKTPEDVRRAARRKAYDNVYRATRIIERESASWQRRNRSTARGQMQELPADKFHRVNIHLQ